MIAFINGQFIPQEQAMVSVLDRGFLYGDGLFETLRVYGGKLFTWRRHWQRLEQGAAFLKIALPYNEIKARCVAEELIARNGMLDAVLRIHLSRGRGARGYSTRGADAPALVMTVHPAPGLDPDNPLRWGLRTASHRLPCDNPLAAHKTANKLVQILARDEAEAAGADEALLLNSQGHVAETASCNLFWIEGDTVCTPPETAGILPGITREIVLELCKKYNLPHAEKNAQPEALFRATGVFLTASTLEIIEAVELDGAPLNTSPVTRQLLGCYRENIAGGEEL